MTVPAHARLGLGDSPESVIDRLPVEGALPEWLTGTLLRNGPGTFAVGQQRYRHWFDGLAMLHRFSIDGGEVSYASRFLEGRARSEATRTGSIAYSEFATDPCRSLFARVSSVFRPTVTDSAKVNIARVADRYLALAETPIQVEFDPETLHSLGVTGWDDSTFGRMTTVHPQLDAARGVGYNLVTRFGASSHYVMREFELNDRSLSTRTIARRRVREPAYIHSFGMSSRYLVVAEFPLVVNPMSLLLWLRPYIENYRWKPGRGTRFHIVDRSTGEAVQDRRDGRLLRLPPRQRVRVRRRPGRRPRRLPGRVHHRRVLREPPRGPGVRAAARHPAPLPPAACRAARREVVVEALSDTGLELPSLDAAWLGQDTHPRYVYGVSVRDRTGFYDQLVKVDIAAGSTTTWHEPDCYPGEGVFVGRPDQARGGRRSHAVGRARRRPRHPRSCSSWTPQSFTELARARLPHPVLFGYHGQFYADGN